MTRLNEEESCLPVRGAGNEAERFSLTSTGTPLDAVDAAAVILGCLLLAKMRLPGEGSSSWSKVDESIRERSCLLTATDWAVSLAEIYKTSELERKCNGLFSVLC